MELERENDLKKYQKMLLNQAERLDNNNLMEDKGKIEIARSGALSQNAISFMKAVSTQIKIYEMSSKYNSTINDINKYLGIDNEKKDK